MKTGKVLVVEDNVLLGISVRDILQPDGYDVTVANDGAAAEEAMAATAFPVVLLDLMLPDTDGQTLLARWSGTYPGTRTIIFTAHGDIAKAVECIKAGAYDFLTKPVERVLLRKTVANAFEQLSLSRQVQVLTQLRERGPQAHGLDEIVAVSPVMQETMELVQTVAENDFSCLLLCGESGTGKGLIAKTVHRIGCRFEQPFVEVNASAMPATLIESELFGHKKGAFTDAKEDRTGLFELADGGTLFLDEIGDMDLGLQSKLLKVIEEQRFRRIGDSNDVTVDVAIIAATNKEIGGMVADGTFREDLYYRLNVVPLQLAPLREHPEDIPALCEYFIGVYAKKFRKQIVGFTEEATNMLLAYDWPGNVREVRNVVERGCLLTRGTDRIPAKHLLFPSEPGVVGPDRAAPVSFVGRGSPASLAEVEKLAIEHAMARTGGNKNQAANILGVHRTTLYKKLEEYGLG